jgi:hypothetical protein
VILDAAAYVLPAHQVRQLAGGGPVGDGQVARAVERHDELVWPLVEVFFFRA